jgi:pyruvate,orthophosphate dikinase
VPPGFLITSEACQDFFAGNSGLAPHLQHNLRQVVKALEKKTKKSFLHPSQSQQLNSGRHQEQAATTLPLLLSVRSSPRVPLPGMTDTILNLGMNDHNCALIAKHFDNSK